ncbi:acyltransferase family protein [Neobacillus vireti]|uniref:acyltransferase family protein n=1 Tax=Neobacillus vireti TaxID=220686 RepID=UPI0030005238
MSNRIEQLDSVRGLASLTVFFHHIYLVAAVPFVPFLFNYTPLRVLINGHAAVILFFVLSGFVLFLPFEKKNIFSYRKFTIRRILRIYFPYLVAISLAMFLATLIPRGNTENLSQWFNKSWNDPVSVQLVIEHISFVLNIHSGLYNNPIWSLIHEMRISLLFPIIALMVLRFNWKVNILISLLLSAVSGLNDHFVFQKSNGYYTTYFDTLHFSSMFIFGALIAKNRKFLVELIRNRTLILKVGMLLSALVLYTFSDLIIYMAKLPVFFYERIVSDFIIMLGVCSILLISIASSRIKSVLMLKPIKFLGDISFSLYLYHLIILLSFMHLFYGIIPVWTIILLCLISSLGVATIAYYLVEVPFMKLGKNLTKFKRRANQFDNKAG